MADKLPPLTSFSREFGPALARVMKTRGVTQVPVAEAIERNQGYVSERLRGLRAVDTDVIAGVAKIAQVDPRTIVREVLAEMRAVIPEPTPIRRERTYAKQVTKAARRSPGKPKL